VTKSFEEKSALAWMKAQAKAICPRMPKDPSVSSLADIIRGSIFIIPELELCPFCGGHAIIIMNPGINWDGKEKHLNVGAGHGTWYVGCPTNYFEGSVPHCEIHPSASWYARLPDAIKAWNSQKIN
jgi:hypothetical protein